MTIYKVFFREDEETSLYYIRTYVKEMAIMMKLEIKKTR